MDKYISILSKYNAIDLVKETYFCLSPGASLNLVSHNLTLSFFLILCSVFFHLLTSSFNITFYLFKTS